LTTDAIEVGSSCLSSTAAGRCRARGHARSCGIVKRARNTDELERDHATPPRRELVRRPATMTATADALVLFGATGDLAHRKLYPALQGLIQRRLLDVPVIGIARSGFTLERLRERIRDSLEHSAEGLDPAAFA